uniref:Uncharacterized protein n=1 Tax=viral metagenome TaxID=1070528 RepID=A0A6C0BNT1_9ZZZZ
MSESPILMYLYLPWVVAMVPEEVNATITTPEEQGPPVLLFGAIIVAGLCLCGALVKLANRSSGNIA